MQTDVVKHRATVTDQSKIKFSNNKAQPMLKSSRATVADKSKIKFSNNTTEQVL